MFNLPENRGCNLGADIYKEKYAVADKEVTIYSLLGAYNTNMFLFETFRDSEYLFNAGLILTKLRMGDFSKKEVV